MWRPRPAPFPEMSEETRQRSLASARKMLREFQRKNHLPIPPSVRKKKKIKTGGSPKTTTSGAHSPADAPRDRATPASPANDTVLRGGVHLTCASSPWTSNRASPKNDGGGKVLTLDENKTMSSTEGVQHVAKQLNRLVSESLSSISEKGLASSTCMLNLELPLQPGGPCSYWQLQQALEREAQLERHVGQLSEALERTRSERDRTAEALRAERAIWQEQAQQFSEQMALKNKEIRSLQQQRDRYLNYLQEYAATYQQHMATFQQLAAEKEKLQKHLKLQVQVTEILQQEATKNRAVTEQTRQELLQTQVKLLDLMGLMKTLMAEHHEGHDTFLAAAQSPAGGAPTAPSAPQELRAANSQDLHKGNLEDNGTSVKGQAPQGEKAPHGPTAGLGNNHCIPFFYHAGEKELKIRTI